MIYLYIKTHRKTGLKYLGKTVQDPFVYPGSGIRWLRHVRKHGNDVNTEILKECKNNEEVKTWGSYYSDLWQVVDNPEWANLKPELGEGGSIKGRPGNTKGLTYEEIQKDTKAAQQRRENHSKLMKEHNPFKGKVHSAESKNKMSEVRKTKIANLSDEERKQLLGHNKGKPWSAARRMAQQQRKNKE